MPQEQVASIPAVLVDLSVRLGGASIRAAELVRGGSHHGWVLACLEGSPVTQYAVERRIPFITLGTRRIDPRILPRLVRLIRERGMQVVDGQNPQSKFWGAWAARRTAIAFVSTINSWPRAEYGTSLRGHAYYLLERILRRGTSLHIAVSSEIEQALLADGVPPSRVVHIPAAIDTQTDSLPVSRLEIRRELGIGPEMPLCCAVGRLATAKGFIHLIDAMGELVRDSADICCLIVGEGPLRESLQSRADELGLANRVRFLGFRPRADALAILAASDLFVMPSLTEGTPVAILEAAFLKRPIVASRVGGIPSLLTDGEHAVLVPPGDSHRLAQAISDLSQRRDHARAMGLRAHQHVRTHFDLRRQVESTLQAYRQAVVHNGRRPQVVS